MNNSKDRVCDLLGRGKDATGDITRRLRASMTKDALNKLFDDAIDKYETLVSQLQRLALSGSEVDTHFGITEVKKSSEDAIKFIRSQLVGLDKEALGEEA